MQAIILAGGIGSRLKPLTNSIPKPLVPVGDVPILEIVLRQLKFFGVKKVTIAVNHLAFMIEQYFKDGKEIGLHIEYSHEGEPLGTAGPIKMVKNIEENFIVMNGDLLTTLNFNDFFSNHKKKSNLATIATFPKEIKIDLGVLEVQNKNFVDYIEKPTYKFIISTGIYAFNKEVINFIPNKKKFDMPDLIKEIHRNEKKIGCYFEPFEWLDIGRIEDYERANNLFIENPDKFLLK